MGLDVGQRWVGLGWGGEYDGIECFHQRRCADIFWQVHTKKMPAKAGGKTGGKGKSAKAKTPKVKGAKKGKRKATRTWSLYIFKVLKQVHSDTGISNKAMNIMNSFINDVFERLAGEASMSACCAPIRLLDSLPIFFFATC